MRVDDLPPPSISRHYAVRMWWISTDCEVIPAPIAVLCDSLEEARAQVPAGTYALPRDEDDDPVIIETWL